MKCVNCDQPKNAHTPTARGPQCKLYGNFYFTAKNAHAVALGRKGGKANKGIPKPKSAENGKKGGRPKKIK